MIDLLRQYRPAIAWLDSPGEEEITLPGFVVMELLQGCSNKIEQTKVEVVLKNSFK
jgi:predicted nucleic acid-binding protein